ncbi:hypothetical protein J2S68_003342 [Glycomyces algeriensis]|nr:hypothetical protein [Glycomyces algeriensis]
MSVEEGRAALGFDGADVEHVLGHDRVADGAQAAPPHGVLAGPGGLAVVAQQGQRGGDVDAGPVPFGASSAGGEFGCAGVQLGVQIVGDRVQSPGLRGVAGRLGRVGDGLHAGPPLVVAGERPHVEGQAEVVGGVLEVAARALGGELEGGVDAVEGEAVLHGPVGVVLAHPGDECAVGRGLAEAVREPLGHGRIEASVSMLDEVVH